jgi:hypothetical protein
MECTRSPAPPYGVHAVASAPPIAQDLAQAEVNDSEGLRAARHHDIFDLYVIVKDAAAVHGGDRFHKFAGKVAGHTGVSESGVRVDATTATPVLDPLKKVDPTVDKLVSHRLSCRQVSSQHQALLLHEQVMHLRYVALAAPCHYVS